MAMIFGYSTKVGYLYAIDNSPVTGYNRQFLLSVCCSRINFGIYASP